MELLIHSVVSDSLGDNADMCIIELVDYNETYSKDTKAAYCIISTVFLLELSYCLKAACTSFGLAITASNKPRFNHLVALMVK